MKRLLLLCLFVYAVQCASTDYDESDLDDTVDPTPKTLDPRGHRPVSRGTDHYSTYNPAPPPVSGSSTYRGRPSTTTTDGSTQEQQKEEQPDAGGCTHLSEKMGVMCPTGCELKSVILKQEKSVKAAVTKLKEDVNDLSKSSNTIYRYVDGLSNALRERQRVSEDNTNVVGQYTNDLEGQHAFVKDTIDTTFPSNIRILQKVLESLRDKIQKVETAIMAQRTKCDKPCTTSCPIPVVSGKECEDIFRKGGDNSEMYLIQPDSFFSPYKVYCDMTTLKGGWTLVQNRQDGSVDFGRRWDDYRAGFGNIASDSGKGFCSNPGEYWLGNDKISQLTKMGPTEVLIEMEDWKGDKVKAQYQQFTVQGEMSGYVLAVGKYQGTAGNSFLDGATELTGENRTMTIHNGMMFSTYDRDNDKWLPGDPTKQCSREDGGGWWYNRCHSSNPNGRYYWGGQYSKDMAKHGTDDGIVWMNWKGSWYSLKAISMKIRPFFAAR
ncbi:fibrinogen beta chain [Anguilla anguilla]|nr:fibrinogen beta chain [Anguilla anguilla]